MVVCSMLLPFIPVSLTPVNPTNTVVVLLKPVMISPEKVEQTLQAHMQWIEIAAVVYLTGFLIFLLRFITQLMQLHRITRRFGIRQREGRRVVFVDRGYSPFSFFNLIFLNEKVVPPESLPTILEHECVHIRQYHTIDMILIELAKIIQWFNPVIWLAGREMKVIHEYLADEAVLQNGISSSTYQQLILDETMGIRVNNLTNNFNVSLLKKRIAMMTKSKSKKWAKSKVLIALPALLVLMFLLTARSYSHTDPGVFAGAPAKVQLTAIPDVEPVIQDKPKQKTQVKYEPVKAVNGVYTVVEKMPSYPGGDDARVQFMVGNIKYPETAVKNKVMGTVYVTFVIKADGSISDVKVLRGIGSGCDEEAVRVIKLMPKWNPGEQKGKPVDVQFNLPIKFTLDSKKQEEPKK
jgi:TonB family protein